MAVVKNPARENFNDSEEFRSENQHVRSGTVHFLSALEG
jgi:hypothetical protein